VTNRLQKQLQHWKKVRPDYPALEGHHRDGGSVIIRYGELEAKYQTIARLWQRHDTPQVVALYCDNSPDITLLALALMADNITTVPIPPFFVAQQIEHLLTSAKVDCIITDQPDHLQLLLKQIRISPRDSHTVDGCCSPLYSYSIAQPSHGIHYDTITFTSGSTGNPKGVCLCNQAILQVAHSLQQVTEANIHDRHLALLPYATLLENIGGVYLPLMAGATIIQPGLSRVGLTGSSGLDHIRMTDALASYHATSCIMIPQMVLGLVAQVAAHPNRRPENLRFAAVGGAPISPTLLARAEALGIALFEGYGLSEAASVVAVNSPKARKIGSVGRPLPHVQLRIHKDGEIWVKGALMEGYLDTDHSMITQCDTDGYWPTGDLGSLDSDSFLHIHGRIKQIFITTFGRNIAPEWVEKELTIEPAIAQAALFGESKPYNVAVIVARDPNGVPSAINNANTRLPDYAQIRQFIIAQAPFSTANQQATINGTPQRVRIAEAYRDAIAKCYAKEYT